MRCLRSFRWICSDQGVEAGLADACDVLALFMHWAAGSSDHGAPTKNEQGCLLPLCVYIPGYNHIIGNLIKEAASRMASFPARLTQLRLATKFLRIYDYRCTLAQRLRSIGATQAADELLKPFPASFVAWRWETLPQAVKELHRLSPVLERYFDAKAFGKLEDENLLHDVTTIFNTKAFHVWLATMAPPCRILERARRWGNWCACCPYDSKVLCPM